MRKALFFSLARALLFVLFLSISNAYGAPQVMDMAGLVPAPIVEADGFVIIVEKRTHRLHLYDGGRRVKSVRITTGKRRGDKEVQDDHKTPEGIYFLTEFLEDKELPARYGARAIVLDYPNPVDKFQGKSGFGIWLHGTNDPPRLERPYDSRGCVVMLNEDLLDLAERITLLRTPVVIVEEMETVTRAEALKVSKKIREWFKRGFDFQLDQVEELAIIKHPAYLMVSFADPKKEGAIERRVIYLREDGDGYAVAGPRHERNAWVWDRELKKAGIGKPQTYIDQDRD